MQKSPKVPPPMKAGDVGKLIDETLMKHQIRIHPAVTSADVPPVSIEIFNAMRETVRSTPAGKYPFPGNKLVRDKQGRLVDGRARAAAMAMEARPPKDNDWTTIDFTKAEVTLWILQTNVNNRHMGNGQRAILFAKSIGSTPRKFQNKLKAFGVSATTVERAQVLLNSGNVDLIKKVQAEQISVSAAVNQLNKAKRDRKSSEDEDGTEAGGRSPPSKLDEWKATTVAERVEAYLVIINCTNDEDDLSGIDDDFKKLWRPTPAEAAKAEALLRRFLELVTAARADQSKSPSLTTTDDNRLVIPLANKPYFVN